MAPSVLKWLKKSPSARSTGSAVLGSSEVVSRQQSMPQSAKNSGAASRAVTVLCDHLDSIIKTFDNDEYLDTELEDLLEKLRFNAAKFRNCTWQGGDSWIYTGQEAALIGVAAACAKAVYIEDPSQKAQIFKDTNLDSRSMKYVIASFNGITKAMSVSIVREKHCAEHEFLVIAVKGTKAVVDWTVNANEDMVNMDGFVGINDLHAHGGFLASAQALVDEVNTVLTENRHHQVVFTGHSAGAAVAQLLFAHFGTLRADLFDKSPHFVGFGGPATFSFPATPEIRAAPAVSQSIILNIIIEGDPVPRVSLDYVQALLNLSLGVPAVESHGPDMPKPAYSFPWAQPYHVGEIMILRDGNNESAEVAVEAFRADGDTFRGMLFADFRRHKMDYYLRLAQDVHKVHLAREEEIAATS